MTKEQIYDLQIHPLMARIIRICRDHRIAFVASFSIPSQDDQGLQCSSALLEQDCEPPANYIEAMRLIYDHPREPLMVTTRDASGQVTRIGAIL